MTFHRLYFRTEGAAKLTGSGGAVIALLPQSDSQLVHKVTKQCQNEGFTMIEAEIMKPRIINRKQVVRL